MKKWLIVLLFTASVAEAINPTDVPAAVDCSLRLVQASQNMLSYAQMIGRLQQNGWTFTVQISTTPIPIPASMQAEIVAKWQSLKQQAATEYGTCP